MLRWYLEYTTENAKTLDNEPSELSESTLRQEPTAQETPHLHTLSSADHLLRKPQNNTLTQHFSRTAGHTLST